MWGRSAQCSTVKCGEEVPSVLQLNVEKKCTVYYSYMWGRSAQCTTVKCGEEVHSLLQLNVGKKCTVYYS